MEFDLVPAGTRVEASGDGAAVDISASQTRTFLLTLFISEQLEQESIDVSIWGSTDGQHWGPKPLFKLPQRFYKGETRQVLDLSVHSEIRWIRPRWDLNRWGRVAPNPMFVFGLRAEEVPAFRGRPSPQPAAAG